MDECLFQGQLTRSSLGKLAFIGELYDIRTESLSSRSMFKSTFPPELIKSRDIGQMEFKYKFIENISDRFEMMNIEGELQISVLLDIISLEGSGKFLKEEKKSQKTVSCSLMCKILNMGEKLFTSFTEILPHVDLTALRDPQYTHVIVEMNWGANCFLSLEHTGSSCQEKQKIEGELEGLLSELKKILSASASGQFKNENLHLLNIENTNIKIYADVVARNGWPTTVTGFCEFVRDVPTLLQSVNNGKGKPLNYVLIPLHTIQKLANLECEIDVLVRKIDESFLLSIVYFFEDVSKVKQKLYDVLERLKENNKYVSNEKLKETKKRLENLSIQESSLKSLISNNWVLVRSGKKNLKDLIKEVERFKNYNFNLLSYEDFLESCEPIFDKIDVVKNYTSKGVLYLGVGEKFSAFVACHLLFEFIVLLVSSEIEEADPNLYRNTCYYFLTLATKPKPKTKYVVIDFDLSPQESIFEEKITQARCYHLKGNKILSSNMYAEHLCDLEKNLAQLKHGSSVEFVKHKPGNRVVLEIMCPGFETESCSSDPLKWCCYRCRDYLEYGFNQYFYCSCGQSSIDSFEYRCNYTNHGTCFISPSPEFLNKVLKTLRPLKELNLLVLGQSGVGKSTWINSIVNYLSYDSLSQAKEKGVISTIPVSFTMYDSKTLKKHVIEIGDTNKNELTEVGASGTQFSHTYTFICEDRCYRIIDTPGLGDTRGIAQDKDNLKNVIEHIGYLKELHGVCILFRANDNRINAFFSYCLKELLTHLHKSVAKNIVFCFTNARNSFYSPGQTSAILEKVIDGLGVEKDLSLGYHNMFCLDNEAFLYLCSLQNPEIQHEESLTASFAQSWQISLTETRRLFDTVKTFEPHLLKETISLVTARSRVLSLTKPLAEISKTIQINLAAMERKKKEILASERAIETLSKKINFIEIHLEAVQLRKPQTVCTSPSCIEYVTHKSIDVTEILYKTVCHNECYVANVTPKTINNSFLKNCIAMVNNKCGVCGCGWENHMHLTYSQKRVEKMSVNKFIEQDMLKEKSEKEKIENFVSNLKDTIEKYKEEQEIIIQTCVKFGMFLRRNAISLYNDSVEDYLTYLIKAEESKLFKSKTEEALLEKLRETLNYYKAEIKVLEEILQKGDNNAEELTVTDINELEQELYKLKLTGEEIRKSVEIGRLSNNKMVSYAETPLQLCTNQRKIHENPTKGAFQRIKQYLLD